MFLSQPLKLISIPSSAFYFVQGPLLSDSIRQGGRGFGGRRAGTAGRRGFSGKAPGPRLRTAPHVADFRFSISSQSRSFSLPGYFPESTWGGSSEQLRPSRRAAWQAILETFPGAALPAPAGVHPVLGRCELASRKHRTSKGFREDVWTSIIVLIIDIFGKKRENYKDVIHHPETFKIFSLLSFSFSHGNIL